MRQEDECVNSHIERNVLREVVCIIRRCEMCWQIMDKYMCGADKKMHLSVPLPASSSEANYTPRYISIVSMYHVWEIMLMTLLMVRHFVIIFRDFCFCFRFVFHLLFTTQAPLCQTTFRIALIYKCQIW